MNNTLVNRDFERAVKQLRRILPKLSFGLLIGTYLISALIMGIFHAQNASNIGFILAAFLVPLAIQAGRGTLVFFFQLNPARIQTRYSMGIIAATALLVLSLWEAYLVMWQYGLSWTVSVSTLMLIGWIIELMILRETMFASQIELYQNKEQWVNLQSYYIAKADFEQFLDDLYDGKRPEIPNLHQSASASSTELPEGSKEQPEAIVEEKPEEEKKEHLLLGNVHSPSLNGHV